MYKSSGTLLTRYVTIAARIALSEELMGKKAAISMVAALHWMPYIVVQCSTKVVTQPEGRENTLGYTGPNVSEAASTHRSPSMSVPVGHSPYGSGAINTSLNRARPHRPLKGLKTTMLFSTSSADKLKFSTCLDSGRALQHLLQEPLRPHTAPAGWGPGDLGEAVGELAVDYARTHVYDSWAV
ncbi:hypothetical protein VOLCADRAFT_98626 [Volvox carteri f. nagariensis]|uniref:Uncharacterized protein n=1 Tax=Volvox carteri f. nagariensis TaxID=3068 RepID=D8UFV0_VOLCA|nr:uncharacterized protein VOLCADRAFT_98626 [Volvox carteri f. nagariensis]EFJ41443.1 hypothetical protein VOLCADRAFT_98626 [Volvox carteri f. nagariensis]|eukprot:XP_002957549.1 hypothetical protein VOLCADRAFT_98626 [Volvox carteri f. nagariensis]